MSTNINDYDYPLPENLIAHIPNTDKSNDKLLKVNLNSNQFDHYNFKKLPDLLTDNDILVFNNTKVIPAQLNAKRKSGASCEILLLEEVTKKKWRAMIKNVRKVNENEELEIPENKSITLIKKQEQPGRHIIQFNNVENILNYLEKWGEVPLPPYISPKENLKKAQQNYQTTFASNPGAVAAPTAGLHFSNNILEKLKRKNIQIEYITLHVGYGTFKPIETDNITHHKMHTEKYHIPKEIAKRLNTGKSNGKRIIAVGTTVTRTLEAATHNNTIQSGWGQTNIYIYPGYTFKTISGLITNFHLPKSTLLCLVSALAGKNKILEAYQEAIHQNYRFFSFGDAMFIG